MDWWSIKMNYFRGDLFTKQNLIFKDSSMLDTRLNGHPVVIPVDIDMNDDFYYFFPITSQIQKRAMEPSRYFLLKRGNGSGLNKTSMVDLKCVYKQRKQSHEVQGCLDERVLDNMIEQFKNYNNKLIDSDSRELLEIV